MGAVVYSFSVEGERITGVTHRSEHIVQVLDQLTPQYLKHPPDNPDNFCDGRDVLNNLRNLQGGHGIPGAAQPLRDCYLRNLTHTRGINRILNMHTIQLSYDTTLTLTIYFSLSTK